MKKIALALLTSALVSAPAMAASKEFHGFHVGVNGGYGIGSGKTDQNFLIPIAPGNQFNSVDLGLKGFRGGLQFGYDFMLTNAFLIGLEASGDFSNLQGSQTRQRAGGGNLLVTDEYRLKRSDSFGIAARLGGIIHNHFLAYVKVGVETAKWTVDLKTNDRINFDIKSSDSKKKRLTGFVTGVGFETKLDKHWYLGGEWTYTMYKDAPQLSLAGNPGGVLNISQNYKTKPRVSDFRLRIGYRF